MPRKKLKKFNDISQNPDIVCDLASIHTNERDLYAKQFLKSIKSQHMIAEIGCGYGEYTIALADELPQSAILGVDLKGDRIWQGMKLAKGEASTLPTKIQFEQKKRDNAYFMRSFVSTQFLEYIPDKYFDEIWITFPDPQIKKIPKQLTYNTLLDQYLRILKPQGKIHLKTDSQFMYSKTKERVKTDYKDELTIETDEPNLYNTELYQNNQLLSIKTRYEIQFSNLGFDITYLMMKKIQ